MAIVNEQTGEKYYTVREVGDMIYAIDRLRINRERFCSLEKDNIAVEDRVGFINDEYIPSIRRYREKVADKVVRQADTEGLLLPLPSGTNVLEEEAQRELNRGRDIVAHLKI